MLSGREWLIRSQTALLISLSAFKRYRQSNPTVRINSYPFTALQVEKENIKDICNHNNHSAVGKNRKGYQFKRKLLIHSSIWPSSLLYH